MLKQEWEIKESIIRSIAWDEPDIRFRFSLNTFKTDVENATNMKQLSNGMFQLYNNYIY